MGSLALLALLSTADAARVETASTRDMTIYATYAWPERLDAGWFPIQLAIENPTDEAKRLELTSNASYGYGIVTKLDVDLAPRSTTHVELILPSWMGSVAGHGLEVYSDGEYQTSLYNLGPYDVAMDRVVVVAQASEAEPGAGEHWADALGNSYSETLSMVTFDQLPKTWSAYTSVDLVVIDTNEGLPTAEQLEPLMAWVRSGGALMVRGEDASPLAAGSSALASWVEPRFALHPHIDGRVMRGLDGYSAGLGVLVVQDTAGYEHELEMRSALVSTEDVPMQHWSTSANRGFRVARPEIPGVGVIPAGKFSLLLFAVGFILGPVNALVIRALKKPPMMLVTTPALALVAAGAIIAYGVASQGLGVQSAAFTITMLDQRAHTSSTLQARQLYAGTSVPEGLRPGAGSWHIPLSMDYEFGFESTETPEEGRTVSGDLLPARIATQSVVLTERPSRLRLTIEGDTIQNGLGTKVERLVVHAADGSWYQLDKPLADGQSAKLKPIDDPAVAVNDFWSSRMARGRSVQAWPHRDIDMPEGTYLAKLAESPFAEDDGLKLDEKVGEHRVVGVYE